MKPLRVGVIYGGRSGEHEVSLASAAAVVANLDPKRYEVVPVHIDKQGRWRISERPPTTFSAAETITAMRLASARALGGAIERTTILELEPADQAKNAQHALVAGAQLDVVFPVLHGPLGEDGTVQGLLELAQLPYVGAGVLASAMGMDKAAMKVSFGAKGLPITDYLVVLRRDLMARSEAIRSQIAEQLSWPVFIKPANMGSSVGITKARDMKQLETGLALAAEFDRKIIVEAAVPEARELECGVLGNDEAEASVVGEIVPAGEFYDYDSKYLDEGSETIIPADISSESAQAVRRLAVEAFHAIDCAGMARVDFLVARESGRVYVNEINTIPGFTTISMFAKLWDASGVSYPALLDRLITLAIERHTEKQALRTSVV